MRSLNILVFSNFWIRVFGILLSFISVATIVRVLGPSGYGSFAIISSFIFLMAIPAQMGLPQIVVRETARNFENGDGEGIIRVWCYARNIALLTSMAVALAGVLAAIFLFSDNEVRNAFLLSLLLLPILSLAAIRTAALGGLGKVGLSQIPENVLRPIVLIGGLWALLSMSESSSITLFNVVVLNICAAIAALLFGAMVLQMYRPKKRSVVELNKVYEKSKGNMRGWLFSAVALGLTGGLQAINANADILMLGGMRSSAEAGIYKIAVTMSGFTILGLHILNAVTMPRFSALHSKNKILEIQYLARWAARIVFGFSMIALLVFLLAGKFLIESAFGEEFHEAYQPMAILTIGQALNAAFGVVSVLLNMCGMEKYNLQAIIVTTILNVILNALLIPYYGINGAAVATAVSLLVGTVLLYLQVRYRLGVDSSFIGRPRGKKI